MLAGRGASPPSLPAAPHAGQSSAQAARQHGCPAPGSSAWHVRRAWRLDQRQLPRRQDSQYACGRDHRAPRRSPCQTAATLMAEPSTAARAAAAAALRPDHDDARASSSTRTEHPQLPQYDPERTDRLDLVVAGGGPAGLAVAERVSAAGYQVRSMLRVTACRLRHCTESTACHAASSGHTKIRCVRSWRMACGVVAAVRFCALSGRRCSPLPPWLDTEKREKAFADAVRGTIACRCVS